MRDKLVVEARRIEEDSLYSSKGHFEAAALWGRVQFGLGLPSAILAAITTVLAFADVGVWAGILALIVVALASVMTFLNPSQQRGLHQTAGDRFHTLRSEVRFFREIDLAGNMTEAKLVHRLREISYEYQEVRSQSPGIPRLAYWNAKRGIERGEANYEVDNG